VQHGPVQPSGLEHLTAARLRARRLDLEPLRADHATELAPLLDDPGLHTFIGGRPLSATQLRERYARLEAGISADGTERWLNWVLRRRDDARAVGTVQATVRSSENGPVADVAWVVASAYQGQGYAAEAGRALLAWLREQGVDDVRALVRPDHEASQRVARALGLAPTAVTVDGEVRWQDTAWG
jgi:RimJ/RimL family protein N-acetyltransferase